MRPLRDLFSVAPGRGCTDAEFVALAQRSTAGWVVDTSPIDAAADRPCLRKPRCTRPRDTSGEPYRRFAGENAAFQLCAHCFAQKDAATELYVLVPPIRLGAALLSALAAEQLVASPAPPPVMTGDADSDVSFDNEDDDAGD